MASSSFHLTKKCLKVNWKANRTFTKMVHLKGRNPWLVCLAGWMIVAPLIFVLIKTINGQEEGDFEWPVVFDPFPDSDEIGPEEPPPSPDCSLACQERVDEAFTQIGT